MGASSFDPILSNVLPETLLIQVCLLFLLKVTRTCKRHDTTSWGHSQAFPTSILAICKNSGLRPGTFSKWEIEHYPVLLTLCQPTYNTRVKKMTICGDMFACLFRLTTYRKSLPALIFHHTLNSIYHLTVRLKTWTMDSLAPRWRWQGRRPLMDLFSG